MLESSLRAEDPVLFDPASYWECRRKGRKIREPMYMDVLERARRFRDDPLFASMQALLTAKPNAPGPDLFHGRTFSTWAGVLEGTLRRIEKGMDPICLEYVADADAFEHDLAAEYPHHGLVEASVPFEVVHGSIAVVPVHELARSPRMGPDVRLTFPYVNWARTPFDHQAFARGVRHLDEAIAALRTISEGMYRSFKDSIHSIALLLHEQTSTSSRAHWPGSIVMGLSAKALQQHDVPFTASLLYHEHAHSKLALYLFSRPGGLDATEQYVSPFKNCCRSAEVILHQLYPITIECVVRLCLMRSGSRDITLALEHLAATTCRLEILVRLLPLIEADADGRAMVDRLQALARTVVAVVDGLVASAAPDLGRRCAAERARVEERHVWDIGQSLVRGSAVRDPGLESYSRHVEGVTYVYRSVERTAYLATSGYGQVESRYRVFEH